MVEPVSTEPSVFSRILAGEIPAEFVLQTDDVFVIRDAAPKAPVHLLVIPKTDEYPDVVALAEGDPRLLAHMVEAAKAAARSMGRTDFRLVFNTGSGAGQTVFHVHAHLLAGGGQDQQSLAGEQGRADGWLDEQTMAGDLEGASLPGERPDAEGTLGRA